LSASGQHEFPARRASVAVHELDALAALLADAYAFHGHEHRAEAVRGVTNPTYLGKRDAR